MENYYYLNANNQQVGPMPASALKAQGIGPNTLVWKQGMASWLPASQVPELNSLFGPAPTGGGATQMGVPPVHGVQQPIHGVQQPVQGVQQPVQQPGNAPYNPAYQNQVQGEMPPSTHLVWAILTTLFCCLPFGIVAIVYAAKVESLWTQGFREQSLQASKNAKTWSIVSACVGGTILIVYIIMVIIAASSSSYYY